MRVIEDVKLGFDDVLMVPQRSTLASRSDVEISREFLFKRSGVYQTFIPIIAANMDGIGTFEMAIALRPLGISVALHKHYTVEQLVQFYRSYDTSERYPPVFYSMGITDSDLAKYEEVNKQVAIHFINIDVANGYTQRFVNFVDRFRNKFGDQRIIMAGTVVTPEITQELILKGADIVRVGIGGGALCLTRRQTGVGYPQLSAVMDCADAAHGLGGFVCSDGGCVVPGDLAKAFGGGADFVMLGTMLSAHDEGLNGMQVRSNVRSNDVREVLIYGMSSKTAVDKHNGGLSNYRSSEGREVWVPVKGPVANTVQDILGGLRSMCTYIGAERLKDVPKRTTFVRVNAGKQLNTSLQD